MNKLFQQINESTVIPIGLAILVFGGGAAWMTTVDSRLSAQATTLTTQQAQNVEVFRDVKSDLKEINQRLYAIEKKIDRLRN